MEISTLISKLRSIEASNVTPNLAIDGIQEDGDVSALITEEESEDERDELIRGKESLIKQL